MNVFTIIVLCFAVLVFARVILEMNSGAGVPSQEYQDLITRRENLQRRDSAKAAEFSERQVYLRKLAQQKQDDADTELAERLEQDFGWDNGKWEWD